VRTHPGIGIALAAALILGGCGNALHAPTEAGPVTSPPAPAREIAELLAAPDSIVIDGATYWAVANINRDFMLGNPDHRATADMHLRSADVDSITTLRPKYVWVIHGTETWGAEVRMIYSARAWGAPEWGMHAAEVRAVAVGGPEWQVQDSVQVVTGISDSTGVIRLLRCPDGVVTSSG